MRVRLFHAAHMHQVLHMTIRGILPALATPDYCTTPDWRLQPSLCSLCTPRLHNRRRPHAQIRLLVEEMGAGAAAVTDAMMSATCSFGAPSSEASCSHTLAERSEASVCTTARLHSILIQSCCRSALNLSSSCSKTAMALCHISAWHCCKQQPGCIECQLPPQCVQHACILWHYTPLDM
jgi:hypothetical protein